MTLFLDEIVVLLLFILFLLSSGVIIKKNTKKFMKVDSLWLPNSFFHHQISMLSDVNSIAI